MGVRRAMEKAIETAESAGDAPVHTFGPLIHNRICVEDLERRGITAVRSPDELEPGSIVIVRAHGIPPAQREAIEERGAKVIDATCPRVIRSQNTVKEHSNRGAHIVIIGDRNHGEITGLAGFAASYDIVQNEEEARQALARWERAGLGFPNGLTVIGQTTLKRDEYDRISGVIRERYPEAAVVHSICPATSKRQESLLEMQVDAFVIIGGKDSANTTRLARTAAGTGRPVWHIEEASELPAEIASFDVIGISAGASTPDRTIDEVEERIRELAEQTGK
jgi:4-hydroxy-3-methylbut-2-enyl diphosphate reductase